MKKNLMLLTALLGLGYVLTGCAGQAGGAVIDCESMQTVGCPEVASTRDLDDDGDGYTPREGDCDDTDPDRNPAAAEICNSVDDNCDGTADEGCDNNGAGAPDYDGDGYCTGDGQCADAGDQPGDCDDTSAAINPGATEVYDSLDNNCNGQIDEGFDLDGDGYPVGHGDCDDYDAAINPGTPEVCADGVDNDCDGLADANDLQGCTGNSTPGSQQVCWWPNGGAYPLGAVLPAVGNSHVELWIDDYGSYRRWETNPAATSTSVGTGGQICANYTGGASSFKLNAMFRAPSAPEASGENFGIHEESSWAFRYYNADEVCRSYGSWTVNGAAFTPEVDDYGTGCDGRRNQ